MATLDAEVAYSDINFVVIATPTNGFGKRYDDRKVHEYGLKKMVLCKSGLIEISSL